MTANIQSLLARFPKTRPSLSPEELTLHKTLLKANRERGTPLTTISHWLESWMHRRVRRGPFDAKHALLEIGAGTLNHLEFEDDRTLYDVVEPFTELYDGKAGQHRIRTYYIDVEAIPPAPLYDRIISIATLEHLTDLPLTVATSGLLLKPDGVFQAGIPSESGFLWGLSWRATFALAHSRKGTRLRWSDHMRYEHVNTAPEIIDIVRYFFSDVSVARFPLPAHHLSLYAAITARGPILDRCREYRDSHKRPSPLQ